MTIKAVFFDMGGTIETFDFTPELRLHATPGIRKLLLGAGIELNLSNEKLYLLVSDGLNNYHKICTTNLDELSPTQIWSNFILNGFSYDLGKLDSISEELMFYIETQYYKRELRPFVPQVLAEIQKMGLKIGIISNVKSKECVPVNLIKYGIRDYFDPIVLSCEYKRRKPDPAIFHYAARLANVPVSQCCYVGDRIQRDVLGAFRAGFGYTVQIIHDFDHGENDEGATPNAVIKEMSELVDVIRTEVNRPSVLNTSTIKALIFDAGDILYHRPEKGVKFEDFVKNLPPTSQNDQSQKKEELVQQAYRGIISQEQYRDAVINLYGISDPEQSKIGKAILENEDNGIEFFEGVRETLQKLKHRGFLLGIVTDTANTISAKLSWFERGGFGHVWDSIISSKELGIRKPDPNIYLAALTQLNLDPCQAVFIGHKQTEIIGAHNVGMKTIAFNYENDVESDFYIDEFKDLLDVPILNRHVEVR
ncbi:MAG: HAD family hydrolase [Anaerolineaceae bacterium]